MEFKLTAKQDEYRELIETTLDNYFLEGPPGTGKSVITRSLNRESSPKHWIVCAPTGLAALNANGKTLHKTFRLPISDGIIHPTFNLFPTDQKVVGFLRYQVKYLLIDEISMVRADTLDFIDRMMREIKNKPFAPFGGIQVVVVGDFFQLPPITKAGEAKKLAEAGWQSPFAFDAKVFSTFKVLSLTEILRQKGDRKFIDLLGRARLGKVEAKDMVLLNDRVDPDPTDLRPRPYAWNSQADQLNASKLRELPGDAIEFEADNFGDWPDYPCDPLLKLKVGAQVMVKKNNADRPPDIEADFESDIVNGTLGIVVEINGRRKQCFECDGSGEIEDNGPKACRSCGGNGFIENDNREDWNVVIEDREGELHRIFWSRWERKVKLDMGNGSWEEKVVATFEQIPLALAWAISMHKSQGQTFDAVHVDASKVFACGQLYVAISRSRTLDGITLQSRINKDRFKTDQAVLDFYDRVKLQQKLDKQVKKPKKKKVHE